MKVRCVDCYEGYPTQGITLCERHQAFDALLEVAKAADQADPDRSLASLVSWSAALAVLDQKHPTWRQWA